MATSNWPSDLGSLLTSRLAIELDQIPDSRTMTLLLETLYLASMRTEEGQPITAQVTYVDPANPHTEGSGRLVQYIPQFIAFNEPIRFSSESFIKIARSTDIRTSSLVVYPNSDSDLMIWGLTDQGNMFHEFVNQSGAGWTKGLGQFQVDVVGVGHLRIIRGFEVLAELVGGRLISKTTDVLHFGPIRALLDIGIQMCLQTIRSNLNEELIARLSNKRGNYIDDAVQRRWLFLIGRLLLRIQSFRHGGAVLITPDLSPNYLDIKYPVSYDRLPTAFTHREVQKLRDTDNALRPRLKIEDFDDPRYTEQEMRAARALLLDISESETEIEGILWFISLLSRIDGVVVLNPQLGLRGFGGFMRVEDVPPTMVLALDEWGRRTQQLDYSHFGSRHRSMMRYCGRVAGSVGFVVSQDGDVRAMTQTASSLMVWENIQLRREYRSASPGEVTNPDVRC